MKKTLGLELYHDVKKTLKSIRNQKKTEKHLLSLTVAEKDLLIYIYKQSKIVSNGVYVPCDNIVAINLKYKRILRRYNISKNVPIRILRLKGTTDSQYCFLYGIRNLPKKFIKAGKIKVANFPSIELRAYLDKYQ